MQDPARAQPSCLKFCGLPYVVAAGNLVSTRLTAGCCDAKTPSKLGRGAAHRRSRRLRPLLPAAPSCGLASPPARRKRAATAPLVPASTPCRPPWPPCRWCWPPARHLQRTQDDKLLTASRTHMVPCRRGRGFRAASMCGHYDRSHGPQPCRCQQRKRRRTACMAQRRTGRRLALTCLSPLCQDLRVECLDDGGLRVPCGGADACPRPRTRRPA